jgi:hypothetical protein
MELKKTPKNPKRFSCQKCQFLTYNKKDYDRHITTRKHRNETDETKKTPNIECDKCNGVLTSRTTLWRHNKTCNVLLDKESDIDTDIEPNSNTEPNLNMISMFNHMMKENQELREILKVQHKQLLDVASETKVVNHINTINNRFNLNFFLNEQCKDAMNLSDFLNNIEVSLEDVSNVGRLGYADGISRIIINALKDMDVYERPIHCSDIKREIMYIKENDIWEKDDERKYQMKRVLKLISHKNVKRLLDWREAHPGWLVYDSKEEAECLRITNESMGGGSDEENERLYKKMIRKIAHETLIDKKIVE